MIKKTKRGDAEYTEKDKSHKKQIMEDYLFNYLAQFIDLTDEEKEALTQLDLFKTYQKGEILLREGQYAQESYFVVKGCIRVYYLKEGEEKTVAFYVEEESISPDSIINNAPSNYFISCEEDSLLMVATPDMEQRFFKRFPKFETLCRLLSEKELAKNQAAFANFVKSTAEERYLHLLKTRPTLIQRVPQYQIASFLGVKPETLSRIRKRLHKKAHVAS